MSQARVGRLPEVPPKRSKQPTPAGPKSVSFETTVTATGHNTGATKLTIFPPLITWLKNAPGAPRVRPKM